MLDSSTSRGYRTISLRFSSDQLDHLDDIITTLAEENGLVPNRSEVVASLSAKRAGDILSGRPMPLLRAPLQDEFTNSTTISVVFTEQQEAVIRKACDGINQKFSPFVVWAVQTYIEKL